MHYDFWMAEEQRLNIRSASDLYASPQFWGIFGGHRFHSLRLRHFSDFKIYFFTRTSRTSVLTWTSIDLCKSHKYMYIYIRYTLNCQNVAFMRFYEMVVQDKSCRIECCFLERILVSFERSMNNFAPIEKFLECMHNLQANRQMRWAVFKNYPAKNIFSSTT